VSSPVEHDILGRVGGSGERTDGLESKADSGKVDVDELHVDERGLLCRVVYVSCSVVCESGRV
jgi:hypothetical protein